MGSRLFLSSLLLTLHSRPGSGHANPKRRESIAYNQNICAQTVRWAMIEWLDDVHLNGPWGVRVDLSILLIESLNFTGRTSYVPISHSNM